MKYIFFILIIFTFVVYSCNRDSTDENITINEFKNDNLISKLSKNAEIYKTALNNKNKKYCDKSLKEIVDICFQLKNKYGEANVERYLKQLIIEERNQNIVLNNNINKMNPDNDGNKCKRNTNGTTNWDECSYWESVMANFSAALHCGNPDFSDSYYNCVQSAVCRNC